IDRVPDSYGPGASMDDPVPADAPRQGEIPREYREASEAELDRRIRAAKAEAGERVEVLGHFYERDVVVKYAAYVGDSFQLAEAAARRSARVQVLFPPCLAARWPMGDMADMAQVEVCREQLMVD